jgi:hypothetical protein
MLSRGSGLRRTKRRHRAEGAAERGAGSYNRATVTAEQPQPAPPREIGGFDPPARRAVLAIWRALKGPDVPETYWLTRWSILRLLGLVYLVAFACAALQLVPLVGEHGLLPARAYLDAIEARHGPGWASFSELPTVFWWDASDRAMQWVAWIGVVLSVAVLLGVSHGGVMLVLWALYLSIDHVGQRWYAFGWETQLLETGFLAVFLAPWTRIGPRARDRPPLLVHLWLYRWLAFRIMLGAGLIKLRGDECWATLTCLDYHFETQPIPHPGSWLLHQLPTWALHGGVLLNHAVELVAPWFVFGPRRARHAAGVLIVGFQVALILSGNLAFLNWLTIVPALACFDDAAWRRVLPRRLSAWLERGPTVAVERRRAPRVVAWVLAAVVAFLSLPVVANLLGWGGQAMNRSYGVLHLVNTYGAFGSVGRERFELVVEGTSAAVPDEDATWREYELPCKPGDPRRRPCIITPYHLRLDWLMWFAALEYEAYGGLSREDWVLHLVYKLLQGDREVMSLFADDPFPAVPPRFIRVVAYRYRFTRWGEDPDAWWHRERVEVLMGPLSVEHPTLLEYLRRRGWRVADG